MDEKTKELIAVGASVAAHCQPCLRFHVDKAVELGIDTDAIAQAVAVGKMVQKGGLAAMRSYADGLLEELAPPEQPRVLRVFEPAMCCSTGICGPSVDERLIVFAGALKRLVAAGIMVERFNLSQQPQAFAADERVKADLATLGHEKLPFIYIDDELHFSGHYPEAAQLFAVLGIDDEQREPGGAVPAGGIGLVMAPAGGAGEEESACCPGGGCC